MARNRAFTLSVVMICCDEEDRIEPALQSVHGWADEIIVFDSGSRDATLQIARRYTDRIWQTDWPGYGPQRNRAIAKAGGDWILSLDADERVTPQLRAEIDALLARPDLPYNVIKMPWRTHFCGRPLRFGRFSTPQTRLFRRQGASYRNLQVHESLLMPERRTHTLKSPLDHHSWRDYQHAQQKHLLYACLLAQQKYAEGRRSSLLYASSRLVFDFLLQYLGRLCVLDGRRGFLVSVILAQYAFHKYAALALMQAGDAPATRPQAAMSTSTPARRLPPRRQRWNTRPALTPTAVHSPALLGARSTPP